MSKLNMKKVSPLFALFLSLFLGGWAQQGTVTTYQNGGDKFAAKKASCRELGIPFEYNDGASLDAAKERLAVEKVATISTSISKIEEFEKNKADWFVNQPAKFNSYVKELGLKTALADESKIQVEKITMADYKSADPEKKAFIDANPGMFQISANENHSTK